MTNTQSTPDISVGELASELGTSISDVQTRARNLAPWMAGPVYVGGRVSGHAADAVRRTYRVSLPITVRDLATELDTPRAWVQDRVDTLTAENRLIVWTDEGTLSAAAADAVRQAYRSDRDAAGQQLQRTGGSHDTCRPEHCDRAPGQAEQPQDITVSALATELHTTVRGITQAADLMRAQTGRDPYTDRTAWYAGDRVLAGGAADAIRRERVPQTVTTLAALARELDVSMSTAAALVTAAGEPLHQVWYGGEVIAPDVADLARRQHREQVPTLDPADVERARIVALLRTHPWGPTFDLDTIGSVADFIEGDDRG